MADLNRDFGGGLDPKQLSAETAQSAADMQRTLEQFTEGMSDATAARYKKLLSQYKEFEDLKITIAKNSDIERLQTALASDKLSNKERKKLEKDLQDEKARVGNVTIRALSSLQEAEYKRASLSSKAKMKQEQADAIASARVTTKEKYRQEWAAAQGDSIKRRQLTIQYRKDIAKSIESEQKERMAALKLQEKAVSKNMKDNGKSMDALVKHPGLKNMGKFTMKLAAEGSEGIEKAAEGLKEAHEAAQEEVKKRKDELEKMKEEGISEDSDAFKEAVQRLAEAEEEEKGLGAAASIADAMDKLGKSIKEGLKNSFMGAFKEVESMLTSYAGKIDARLQGSDESYRDATNTISTLLSISPYIKSKAVIENMPKLVDSGIAYNLEQRAFLGTVSEKIANTFDAFDSNLARLIRLQQADTTAARLGMEAALTQFLNGMYQDTSYMSGAMDTVSSTLIDASSTMTRNMSAEFEYVVHKWMGSLSSVGMSDETINQIVTGISYLATGDVQSLANNTQIQTLLAMSAAKSGQEYSELLLEGLDAEKTNNLLGSMVSYLKEIAEGAGNQVVRAAYGDVFNLSMSDMKAISNLRAGDISSISSSALSYSGMEQELQSQFSALITRTTISEMIDNLYNNAVFGVAEDLMTNPVTYGMYKMLEFMDEQKLKINVPFVNVAGFGLGLENTVNGIMQLGLGLSSAMSLVGNIMAGLKSGGPFNLDAWGGTEYTQRGSSSAFSTAGSAGETSGSTYVASGSADDMQASTLNQATDDAQKTSEITNKNSDPGKTIDDLYKTTVDESNGGFLRTTDLSILAAFKDTGNSFIHTQDSRMRFDASNYLYTRDYVMYNAFTKVFGTGSLQENGRLRADVLIGGQDLRTDYDIEYDTQVNNIKNDSTDNDKLAVLQVYDSHAVEAIKAMGTFSKEVIIDSFSETAKKTLVEQIANQITGSGATEGKTMANLYKLFSDANGSDKAHVRVQNEDGKRLQVDTESYNFDDEAYAGRSTTTNSPWQDFDSTLKNIKW